MLVKLEKHSEARCASVTFLITGTGSGHTAGKHASRFSSWLHMWPPRSERHICNLPVQSGPSSCPETKLDEASQGPFTVRLILDDVHGPINL